MQKHYLKTWFRNLLRHKSYTFINVLGLTVGLVTSIFILLWIKDELAFDRYHSNADHIFKVMVNNTYPDGKIETLCGHSGQAEGCNRTGIISVGYLSAKAALSNPVDSLLNE